jgi:hypothetical protein
MKPVANVLNRKTSSQAFVINFVESANFDKVIDQACDEDADLRAVAHAQLAQ